MASAWIHIDPKQKWRPVHGRLICRELKFERLERQAAPSRCGLPARAERQIAGT
jgi:hypothetical protein